jgi:hypothetical protein
MVVDCGLDLPRGRSNAPDMAVARLARPLLRDSERIVYPVFFQQQELHQ